MSKKPDKSGEMRDQYDFSRGVRGKYAKRFKDGSNVVVLEPDVAAEFKTSQAVNKALRAHLKTQKSGKGSA